MMRINRYNIVSFPNHFYSRRQSMHPHDVYLHDFVHLQMKEDARSSHGSCNQS